jgi:Zn-finger nucleic acid-binding protein
MIKHFCGDCGALPKANHSNNCDIERCPRCKGQLLSCDCNFINRGAGKEDQFLIDNEGKEWKRFVVQNSIEEDFDIGGKE